MVRGLLLLLSLLMLWAVLLVLLAGTMEVTTVALQNFTLGFLLPSRSSEMTSLVTEWETAFCVAVEVLNSGKQTYHLLPYSKLSGSDTVNSIWDFFMYGAGAQAEAVPASIVKLHMSNVTIIYTMGHYALNLANNINNKRLEFPWWYFGTDRVTAFDPADEFETGGDYTQNYISKKFHSYWRTTNYSGLPAVGQNKSCTYTPYLIDTVTAYFEVCDALWNHSLSITAENILKALNRSGPLETHPWFQGRTGLVAMDSTTGSQEC
ncbi:unnamed protein product [Sphagnum jensenii]|uniref:Uncharacterized protein n=1 Tax=Sphagnum jensenii TaxID=128206 RepID=A0ABP1APN1_9BRYO